MPPAPTKKAVAKKAPAKKAAAKKLPAKKAAAPTKKAAAPRKTPAKGNLPPQIMPLNDGSGDLPRILIYGEPSTGKTVLAGTAPRALFLEADRGDVSAGIRGSDAQKWEITDWDDMGQALSWLQNGGHENFEYAILDTVSMFSDRGLANIMEDLVAVKPNRKVWLPDKGEYGQNMNRLKRWMGEFCELPMGIIVTAHIQQETDHEGETRFMPMIQGKNMPDKICSYFDVVGHMSMRTKDGEEVPRFSTKKEGKYYAKDRYDGAVGAIVDPTIPKITRRIEQARKG